MTNIAGERGMFAQQGLVLRSREQWGAVYGNYGSSRPVEVPATRVFLHIAVVTPTSMDATQRLIERIGISRFPSTGMSYNASVWFDGTLLEGQPLTRRGAHTVNDKGLSSCPTHGGPLTAPGSPMNLNVNSRAIVLPQSLADGVTDAQVHGVAKWAAAQIRGGYMVRGVTWHGHRCVANKDCPGARGWARLGDIQQLTAHYVANGVGAGGGDMPLTNADGPIIQGSVRATPIKHRNVDANLEVVLADTLVVVQGIGAKADAQGAALASLAEIIARNETNDLTAEQVKRIVEDAVAAAVNPDPVEPPTPS